MSLRLDELRHTINASQQFPDFEFELCSLVYKKIVVTLLASSVLKYQTTKDLPLWIIQNGNVESENLRHCFFCYSCKVS